MLLDSLDSDFTSDIKILKNLNCNSIQTITNVPSPVNNLDAVNKSYVDASVGNVYSVKLYGAVGDGITDDTNAINTALTTAGNNNGGIVIVPEGKYLLNSSLAIPSGVTLSGCSVIYGSSKNSLTNLRGSVFIVPVSNTSNVVIMNNSSSLQNLEFYYKDINTSSATIPTSYSDTLSIIGTNVNISCVNFGVVPKIANITNDNVIFKQVSGFPLIYGIQNNSNNLILHDILFTPTTWLNFNTSTMYTNLTGNIAINVNNVNASQINLEGSVSVSGNVTNYNIIGNCNTNGILNLVNGTVTNGTMTISNTTAQIINSLFTASRSITNAINITNSLFCFVSGNISGNYTKGINVTDSLSVLKLFSINIDNTITRLSNSNASVYCDINPSGTNYLNNLTVSGAFSAGIITSDSITTSNLINTASINIVKQTRFTNGTLKTLKLVFTLTPSASTTTTSYLFNLPSISSNISNKYDVYGTISGYDANNIQLNNCVLSGVTGTTNAQISFTSSGNVNLHTIIINVDYV